MLLSWALHFPVISASCHYPIFSFMFHFQREISSPKVTWLTKKSKIDNDINTPAWWHDWPPTLYAQWFDLTLLSQSGNCINYKDWDGSVKWDADSFEINDIPEVMPSICNSVLFMLTYIKFIIHHTIYFSDFVIHNFFMQELFKLSVYWVFCHFKWIKSVFLEFVQSCLKLCASSDCFKLTFK